MSLRRMVVAGPRDHITGLPRRLDACGSFIAGGLAPWTFETVAGGRAPLQPGEEPRTAPVWRLRTGFGTTEQGCIVVGLALALAATPGAGEPGLALIRRRQLRPGQDIVVIPDVVQAATPITDLPLAVVITSTEDAAPLKAALDATTRWSVTIAVTSPR